MRFRLRTLLILVAIAGPLLALWLRPLLTPRANVSSSNLQFDKGLPSIKTVAVCEPSGRRDFLFAVVYPGTVPYGFIDAPASFSKPMAKGISIHGTEVYLDGKQQPIKHVPCILVLDPAERTFVEIPIHSQVQPSVKADDLVALPEWKTEVAPRVDEMKAWLLKERGF